jgi:hypothetical protein
MNLGIIFQWKILWTGSMALLTGGAAVSTLDCWRCGQEVQRRFTGMRQVSAGGHRCSLAMVGEDEEDTVSLMVSSPEQERRR